MSFDILRYRAALTQCREDFIMHYPAEIAAFDQLDKVFPRYAPALGHIPVVLQKHSFQLTPFLHVMQRRARTAFEHLSARQSSLAWIALRTFLESPLIIGKWIDDPQNAVIWNSRNTGKAARKEYQDVYFGESLRPRSLPGADFLRSLLQHVLPKGFRRARNYGFLHPNKKGLIALLHIVLRVKPRIPLGEAKPRPKFLCPCCGAPMTVKRRRI